MHGGVSKSDSDIGSVLLFDVDAGNVTADSVEDGFELELDCWVEGFVAADSDSDSLGVADSSDLF